MYNKKKTLSELNIFNEKVIFMFIEKTSQKAFWVFVMPPYADSPNQN